MSRLVPQALLALVFSILFFAPAQAARHHHFRSATPRVVSNLEIAGWNTAAPSNHRFAHRGAWAQIVSSEATSSEAIRTVQHPAGCPASAFCGCGASVQVFGHPVRELWLASNWFRFPPTSPAPGMAAVRAHHVVVIMEMRGGGRAVVYDANSGRGETHIHEMSLAGYSVRNPHAGWQPGA